MHGTFYTVNCLTSQRVRFRFVLGRAEVRGRGKRREKKRGTEENLEEERENYCWYVCTERNSVEERGERKKEERSQEDWCGVLPYLEVTCACFIKTYARDFSCGRCISWKTPWKTWKVHGRFIPGNNMLSALSSARGSVKTLARTVHAMPSMRCFGSLARHVSTTSWL